MNIPNQNEELATTLAAELAHFTGTESYTNLRYPWLRKRFLLTEGTRHLAEKAQAFWLMGCHCIPSNVGFY
jgi:hypothetical protein